MQSKGALSDNSKNFQHYSIRVERAIRHAIEVAWDRGDIDILQKFLVTLYQILRVSQPL